MSTENATTTTLLSPQDLLKHWQGHRGLTRRVIEAFPEKELFEYTIGGMRTFAQLVMEIIDLTGPGAKGLATDDWGPKDMPHITGNNMPVTKAELLERWDDTTTELETYWPQIDDFEKSIIAFGQYPGTALSMALYFIDNEIHHRGQGYVYLRGLGIEPPFFWDRP
ncbi:damage-inducible protein DinB [Flavobacterium zepuense]|uniref:Damage-inducible protein DinB n=1 Tax=Flavobacterium zepuense TaxID=2593302 RepID=A0A552UX64_9FLAO|nr:DinB family protein [Flavobacterium zepuense]TRW22802.1 damage-inducible protein DinB [Flavobacterium zepuense]